MFDALDFPGNHVLLCMYYFAKELVKEYTEVVRKNDFFKFGISNEWDRLHRIILCIFVNIAKGFKVE